jgi:glyoxylase-like metal-dependent hydrolase (beta-lactamase superfamily II)
MLSLLLSGPFSSSAQSFSEVEKPGQASADTRLNAALVKTGLFLISGPGGNSLLRLSANGFILVDGQLPGSYDAILALVQKVSYSEQPIRILVNTDHHENHTALNEEFIESGTFVLAQENVKKSLTNISSSRRTIALPNRTYDQEFTIKLGGIEVQLLHFGNAHTNGDTVVYFPDLKVVAVGDLYAASPNPDFSAGGSLVGWGPVLDRILQLDFDVVVPGTGPVVTRVELNDIKKKIDAVVSLATELVKRGVPKDQLIAQIRSDDLGRRLSFSGPQLDSFYAEVAKAK